MIDFEYRGFWIPIGYHCYELWRWSDIVWVVAKLIAISLYVIGEATAITMFVIYVVGKCS